MRTVAALVAGVLLASMYAAGQGASPAGLRLYVFDCGRLASADMTRYRLAAAEVATTTMSVACFLVAHPRGTLMWDVGAIPDAAWRPTGRPERQRVTLPDGQTREVTMTVPLLPQLAAAGFKPDAVTYLALSHYHWDHTANANAFSAATWLVRPAERDAMWATPPPPLTQPSTYSALRASRATVITTDDYDLFGDGSVVLKLAAGHTPGHQVLFVRLPRTGPVVLSGDLYHYREERTLKRVPTFEADERKTAISRANLEAFLSRTGAQLWIQHDSIGHAALRKGPAFYD